VCGCSEVCPVEAIILDVCDDKSEFQVGETLIERKFRMLQIQGRKGEAVVVYCEPLITREMGYHRLSSEGKQSGVLS
jgi:hypothetical protein